MPSTKHDTCAHPDCLRKEEKQLIKGRGLCRACYNKAQRQGWLHSWRPPVKDDTAAPTVEDLLPPVTTKTSSPLVTESLPSLDVQAQAPTSPPEPSPAATPTPPPQKRSNPVEKIAKQARKAVKQATQDFKVAVDFTAAAHVLEEIKVRAEREMRPVPLQILWELKRAMDGDEEAA